METEFSKIVEQYADSLFRFAFSFCANREDAEDIVQDVFVKYLKAKPVFSEETQCRAWLMKATANRSRDVLRNVWRQRRQPLDEALAFIPEEREDGAVFSALMGLEAKYRAVVYLYYYEELSVREIAASVGASESAVRMRLLRARQQLKQQLGGIWNEAD